MKAEGRMMEGEWPREPLRELCSFLNGGTPSKSVEHYFQGDIPWITGADITGPVVSNARSYITEEAIRSSATNRVPKGTVLLVTRTSVGKVAIAGQDLCFSQDITALTPESSLLDAGYLVEFLKTRAEHMERQARGATIKGITRDIVADLEIPLPPLAEQRRIAEVLDRAEALRAKRRAALTQSLFLDLFGNPIVNPKKWRACAVGEIANCIVPGRDKPKSFTGHIPWITTDDLHHLESTFSSPKNLGLSEAEISEVRARVIPEGSVIISCVGDLGIVSLAGVEMVINQQLHSFQCRDTLHAVFLMHCLAFQKAFMYAKASSTTLPYMNKTVCNSIPITVPPIELQREFARQVSAVEKMKAAQRASLAEMDTLFASLQYRAFKGEL